MIRLIESDDYKRCYDVITSSFEDVNQSLQATPETCPGNSAFMTYNQFLNKTRKMDLYGFYEGELIACIGLIKKSDVSYKIKMLSVMSAYRHKGIGRLLVDHMTQLASGKLKLGMIYENKRLYEWYLSLGFQTTKIVAYKGNGFHVAYMEKKIETNI